MDSLTPLDQCLDAALHDLARAAPERVPLSAAIGAPLAEALVFLHDMPPAPEALREGFAVSAMSLVGASAAVPIPLSAPMRVAPPAILPPGCDAVLPPDGAEVTSSGWEAIRPVNPGQGVRRTGHDGRADALIAPAGAWVSARLCLAAALSGHDTCTIRRPRVVIALPDAAQAAFAGRFFGQLGGQIVAEAPHLILQQSTSTHQRLALAPAETAWLAREGGALVLSVPHRFDGMVAACLGLGVPAMAALHGAAPIAVARPLTRKLSSALGMAELALLTRQDTCWQPGPAGTVTLSALATANAYAIIPPDSEGVAAETLLAGFSLSSPFGGT